MKISRTLAALAIVAAVILSTRLTLAANWIGTSGDGNSSGLWLTATNWSTTSGETLPPDATDAVAVFPGSPLTAARAISLDSAGGTNTVTVGSLSINNSGINSSSTIANSINNYSSGTDPGDQTQPHATLEFDATGAGPATITLSGTGTAQNRINASMLFTDNVVVNVTSTSAANAAGNLSILGPITGSGGFTKTGPGTVTMAFVVGLTGQNHDYTGPTVVNEGRFRFSGGGAPRYTSDVTVNNGGQLLMTTANSTYAFGTQLGSPPILHLNGNGLASTNPVGWFPGAIRADLAGITVTNPIDLQSDTALNVITTTGVLTLTNVISGVGRLEMGAMPGDPTSQGQLRLDGNNSYTGGTLVTQGTLVVRTGSNLGSGSVMVDGTSPGPNASRAAGRLQLQVSNAINDSSYLNLTGDEGADSAIGGYAILDSGVNEQVGGLMLGGKIIPDGTYGSVASGAANNSTLTGLSLNPDSFFQGAGVVTVQNVGLPGDYNSNNSGDIADYVQWRKGGSLDHDFTPGNQANDYFLWRENFGNTYPGSSAPLGQAPVPEPTTCALLIVMLSLLGVSRRR